MTKHSRGFTVMELIVTMAMITMMAGLILPAIHQATEASRRVHCTSNLRQLGLALHEFHEAHQQLPAGWSSPLVADTAWGWASELLPEIEQKAVAGHLSRNLSISAAAHQEVRDTAPAIFRCPSDSADLTFDLYQDDAGSSSAAGTTEQVLLSLPHSNYVGIFGTSDPDEPIGKFGDGTFPGTVGIQWKQLTRGLSNVAMIGERTARQLPSTWLGVDLRGEDAIERVTGFMDLGPNRTDSDEAELSSRHAQGINLLFADGHVRFVADQIDQTAYRQMARRGD
jgi:prepilin-type processing-associated H-X9-DG protein